MPISKRKISDKKLSDWANRLAKFQRAYYKEWVELSLRTENKLFKKSAVYDYYKVSDKTFKNWIEAYCTQGFCKQISGPEKFITANQWEHIVSNLGYCFKELRNTKNKKDLIEILYCIDDPTTKDYEALKQLFAEKIMLGNHYFEMMDVFPPSIVTNFLKSCNSDLVYEEQKDELKTFNRSLRIEMKGNSTIKIGKTRITRIDKDENSSVTVFPAAYDLPELYDQENQSIEKFKKQKQIFNKSLLVAKISKRTKLGQALIELHNKRKFSALLNLTMSR
jgi:hypothetical protein